MPRELRAIGNYAVSNLILRHHYKGAASQYLRDSISEDPSYFEKNNLNRTLFCYSKLKYLRKKIIEPAFKVNFPIPNGENLG